MNNNSHEQQASSGSPQRLNIDELLKRPTVEDRTLAPPSQAGMSGRLPVSERHSAPGGSADAHLPAHKRAQRSVTKLLEIAHANLNIAGALHNVARALRSSHTAEEEGIARQKARLRTAARVLSGRLKEIANENSGRSSDVDGSG